MASAAGEAVKSFFVTLRRSPIGAPHFHKRILASLGLDRRHDCVERPNTPIVRGQLEKVRVRNAQSKCRDAHHELGRDAPAAAGLGCKQHYAHMLRPPFPSLAAACPR